jgi:membrane-bound serine protease (ClpP class)
MVVRRFLLLLMFLVLPGPGAEVLRVAIDGVIHPVTVEIVSDAIAQAQRDNAKVILLQIDTPGGLLEATREVTQKIISSSVPVVTWVAPSGSRAASAGFFILLSGDIAVMAPGTRTGAASPVQLGQEMDPVMRKKVESDASAWIRSLASQRGRDGSLAEKAVLEAKSFTEQEALQAKLIDFIAADEQQLLQALDGRELSMFNRDRRKLDLRGAAIRDYKPTLRQNIIRAIANPNIAFLLLIAGALGLYIEFTVPGAILPGVAGALCLLFGLAALSVLPINWLGAALLVLALALFVAEAFVSSYGVLAVGGVVAFVFGALLLVDGPPALRIGLGTALSVALPFAAISAFLATLVVRAHREKSPTGESGMIGKIAVARTTLDPEGKVFVHGEYWDASSPVTVPEGAQVRVIAVDGLRLRVEPVQ